MIIRAIVLTGAVLLAVPAHAAEGLNPDGSCVSKVNCLDRHVTGKQRSEVLNLFNVQEMGTLLQGYECPARPAAVHWTQIGAAYWALYQCGAAGPRYVASAGDGAYLIRRTTATTVFKAIAEIAAAQPLPGLK